jgi:hypothetical protein
MIAPFPDDEMPKHSGSRKSRRQSAITIQTPSPIFSYNKHLMFDEASMGYFSPPVNDLFGS